jgi:hypothetical protein
MENIGTETLTQAIRTNKEQQLPRLGKKPLTSKFGRQLRMKVATVEIDPKFRDAAYFVVRRETYRKSA